MSKKHRRSVETAAARAPSGGAVPRAGGATLSALLLGSGFAALVFETLWVKQLGRVVGVEVHAVTIALSAFFGGLALGGVMIGRLSDRTARPVRLYAALEAGVAVLGVFTTLALSRSAAPFVQMREAVGPFAWVLPFVLVGAPSFLMGGTLPALLRALRPSGDAVAPATGLLYAANTAGAVAGTLAVPFVLVPLLGIRGAGMFAACVGLAVAAAALALDRSSALARTAPALQTEPPAGAPSRDARTALALYAIAGGVALGYEVVWSELLVQFLSTRTYAFAVMLGTYLTGLALGSVLFARFSRPRHDPWWNFGVLLAAAGVTAIGSAAVLGSWLPDAQTWAGMWAMRLSGRETIEVVARFIVASAAILLVPTTLLGAAFPAAARLTAGADRIGGDVGTVAALNTAGGIAGTLLTGFVLVPGLGLVWSLGALAAAGAVLGAIAVLKSRRAFAAVTAAAFVCGAGLLAVATPPDKLAQLLAEKRGGALVFYEEHTGGTVAVLEQRPPAGAPFRRLYIQGVSNSGDSMTSLRYMRLQALLPLLVHPGEPKSALVVGFGTGITAGAMLAYPGLEKRVVAELLPAVVRAGRLFTGNFGAASDSRLDIRIGDGRQELLRSSERYDLITLEPPPPSAAGVVNLYSSDFYAICRERLAPGGLMAQWWPLPAQNDEDSQSLVRSFLDAFPHAQAWSTELHEVLLVGSMRPLGLDGPRIAARFAAPEVAAALAEVGVESPEALLATWITGRKGLERYVGNASPVTDDRPLVEHGAWVRRGEIGRVLPRLLESATDVPLPSEDPIRSAVAAERSELFDFYRASLELMRGQRGTAAPALRAVLARDPQNPYYRWLITGR